MSQWQPIETAPKDGTPVVVWFNGGAHVARYAPLWNENNLRWLVQHPSFETSGSRLVSEISPNMFQEQLGMVGPTHWMAIPDPPPQENEA